MMLIHHNFLSNDTFVVVNACFMQSTFTHCFRLKIGTNEVNQPDDGGVCLKALFVMFSYSGPHQKTKIIFA